MIRAVLLGLLALVMMAAITQVVPPLVLRDADAPGIVASVVDDARQTVRASSRVFPLPLHPRLIDARCFAGGSVALYFEEWVPPYLGHRYAVMVGSRSTGDHGWEGGYHLDSIGPGSQIERDYVSQLGDEVACG